MNVETLFRQINGAYRGTDDDAPQLTSTDGELWLDTVNRKIAEYARDGKVLRSSLFATASVGTVVAGTQTYNLDTTFLLPASSLKVRKLDGTYDDYQIIEPQERGRFTRSVYFKGLNPQTVTFVDTIDADSNIVGGTIEVDGYFLPAELTALTDTVPVDDPFWLVYATASELAFNDLTYESKTADLNAKANNLYSMMSANNRRGTHNNPRKVATNLNRILDTANEQSRHF